MKNDNGFKHDMFCDNILEIYFKEITDIPLLTQEEEKRLFIEFKNGNNLSKEKLIISNLKLVIYVAKKYNNKNVSFSDLIQEGNIALMRAIDYYDINMGLKFSTYASNAIKNSILRYINEKDKLIRIPSYLHKYIRMYKELIETKSNLSDAEIIKIMNISKSLLEKIKRASYSIISTDLTVDINTNIEDTLIYLDDSFEDLVIEKIDSDVVESLLYVLDERQKEVIINRYGFYDNEILTYRVIAEKLGVTYQRVMNIEKQALEKLRKEYNKGYSKRIKG